MVVEMISTQISEYCGIHLHRGNTPLSQRVRGGLQGYRGGSSAYNVGEDPLTGNRIGRCKRRPVAG